MNKSHQNKKNDSSYLLDSSLAFEGFVEQAKKIVPGDTLECSLKHFQEESESYNGVMQRFVKTIKETSLLANFLGWIQSKEPYDIDMDNARILMESGLIPFVGDKGKILTLADVRVFELR